MKRYLQFSNIGRGKFSGQKLLHPEISTPDEIASVAWQEANKHLVSKNFACTYNPYENKGTVLAGSRIVGTFSVVSEALSKI